MHQPIKRQKEQKFVKTNTEKQPFFVQLCAENQSNQETVLPIIFKLTLRLSYFNTNLNKRSLRAAETTVSRRICAGFNLQLSTLNPVSPDEHCAGWSTEIFMRWSPARHFFRSVFRLLPQKPYILPIPWRPCVPIDRTISMKWRWKKIADSSDHQVSLCRYAAQFRYGSMKTHHCASFLRNWGGGKAPCD